MCMKLWQFWMKVTSHRKLVISSWITAASFQCESGQSFPRMVCLWMNTLRMRDCSPETLLQRAWLPRGNLSQFASLQQYDSLFFASWDNLLEKVLSNLESPCWIGGDGGDNPNRRHSCPFHSSVPSRHRHRIYRSGEFCLYHLIAFSLRGREWRNKHMDNHKTCQSRDFL